MYLWDLMIIAFFEAFDLCFYAIKLQLQLLYLLVSLTAFLPSFFAFLSDDVLQLILSGFKTMSEVLYIILNRKRVT